MKKNKFKVGDKVYWDSKKQGRRISGTIVEVIEYQFIDTEYAIECGKDHRWQVPQKMLRKDKTK